MVVVEFGLEGWSNELDVGCENSVHLQVAPAAPAVLRGWSLRAQQLMLHCLKRAQAACDEHRGWQREKVMNWGCRHVLLGGFGGPVWHGCCRKGGKDVRKVMDVGCIDAAVVGPEVPQGGTRHDLSMTIECLKLDLVGMRTCRQRWWLLLFGSMPAGNQRNT
ncbi:hypothetical protein B0H19DRAFT_1067117 [Mycena capillaripes]|nr:hypothetical protein B0H19DRAFT_1067117 [Mycena capillaripes]